MLAAQADLAPALIYGASGTGKGAIAKWIHSTGPRSGRTLLTATRDIPLAEQIRRAQGGTLIIPEIGEWPLSEQRILLEFLKTKTIPQTQAGVQMLANVRIITTTSQSLEGRAQGGLFNPALLEKLNVFRIEMPPLAKRLDEFEDIALGIVGEIARELHKEFVKSLSAQALDKLRSYDWPSNLRELRNVLRLAVIAAKDAEIALSDLPEFGHDRIDFRATREQFEKIYILELLRAFEGEIDKTCEITRMDKTALLAKINKYGIDLSQLKNSHS